MEEAGYIWQDREIRFDITKKELHLTKGEESLDTISNIEDSKGSNGDIGTFLFTNLRLIWYCNIKPEVNISIGYDTIMSTTENEYTSKISGETKALNISCKFGSERYSLMFNSVSESAPNLLTALQTILKIYEASRLYRDFKFKSNITKDKKLQLLPDENVTQHYSQVSFISSSDRKSYVGSLILTNIRFVWICNTVDNYNISSPWIQIKTVKSTGDMKYGDVISMDIMKFFGGGIYLFAVPPQNFDKVLDDVTKAVFYYKDCPILGIDIKKYLNVDSKSEQKKGGESFEEKKKNMISNYNKIIDSKKEDENEIVDQNFINETSNALAYAENYSNDKQTGITDIVFNKELGIACEKLPDGVSIEKLWKIIN